MDKQKYFFEALCLAKKVKGSTSPNPAVGCIIVKDKKIIGRGATQKTGRDHAEIAALKEAGISSKGADLYVTMEPCIEFQGKKTPSCTKKIIEAGIKKVIVGVKDPNPYVNGQGFLELKRAGIDVYFTKDYLDELKTLNEDYDKYIKTKIPFVYLKCAMTLDGNIAAAGGDSKWISGEESRHWVHGLRNRVDSVMVGVGTIINDNPQLNVRLPERLKDPIRLIIDPYGKTPPDSRVMIDDGNTIFLVKSGIPNEFKRICDKNKRQYLEFDTVDDDRISIKNIIKSLGKEFNLESILIEGGGRVFYYAIKEKIVDKIIVFLAPKILGGKGVPFLNGTVNIKMSEALIIKDISVENIGKDLLIQGYL